MEEVVNNFFEDELYYKDYLVLKYRIEYPQIIKSRYRYGAQRFNLYNYNKAIELKKYCENELLIEAKKLYDHNISNGYPMIVFEVSFNYQITYNKNGIISLYTDEYVFSGGAHGITKRESQNWNLQNGKIIALSDFFQNNSYFVIDILKEINNQIEYQIKNGQNQYFNNYCKLVQENIKFENYYITDNGIALFFNQYEIAPYSSGILVFIIKK